MEVPNLNFDERSWNRYKRKKSRCETATNENEFSEFLFLGRIELQVFI